MDAEKRFQITYLQSECLLKYSQYVKKPLDECSQLFYKYHIFEYISSCYDYLHLSGIEYIVRDIKDRIKEGETFVARFEE